MESYNYVNVYSFTLLQDSTSIEECWDTGMMEIDKNPSSYKILAEQEI